MARLPRGGDLLGKAQGLLAGAKDANEQKMRVRTRGTTDLIPQGNNCSSHNAPPWR
jgi:hypothetical protein